MKKFLIIFATFVSIVGVAHAADTGFVALAPIPGLTSGTGSVVDSGTLTTFFNNLYKYLIGLAAILAVIEIIRGGIEISTQDSVSKQGVGRHRIEQAIMGLILVLAPVLVFTIINPSILNLSLNLPALDTKSGTPLGGSPSGGTVGKGDTYTDSTGAAVTVPDSGCKTVSSGSYLSTKACAADATSQQMDCGNGLTTQIFSSNSSEKLIYCGASKVVTYYTCVGASEPELVIPSDSAAQSTFASGCQGDRGKMSAENTRGAGFVGGWIDYLSSSLCSSSVSGLPATNKAGQACRAKCYSKFLACRPN